jgi:hypothetical protein
MIILRIEALFAVGRWIRPHSHDAVAAVPPRVQEGGQENLAEKHDRRDRNDVFGVQ